MTIISSYYANKQPRQNNHHYKTNSGKNDYYNIKTGSNHYYHFNLDPNNNNNGTW